jgi:hypothetical protein
MNYSKPLPDVTERASSPEERKRRKRASFGFYCSILFSVLWLAPAVFILFINFRGQINPRAGVIGQSIGCLGDSERCRLNLQDVNQISQAQKLAKLDKNALGALQLAAKALEVWFVTIATSLIFTMVKIIARSTSRPSLPLRFIYIHDALGELGSLGKLLLLEPLGKPFKKLLRQIRRGHLSEHQPIFHNNGDWGLSLWCRIELYLFSIFVVLVSIVCSLMGPATAVLVLPTMQWTEINIDSGSPQIWLDTIEAGQASVDIPVPPCTSDSFALGNFSCLGSYYSAFVDSLAASAVATDTQAFLGGGDNSGIGNTLVVLPVFQEGNVTFSANISGANPTIWVPLRQTLRGFNEDVEDYDLATSMSGLPRRGYPDSDLFNKSLQARLQRDGPTVGMQTNCRLNGDEHTVSSLTLGTDQMVRCYKGTNATNCIPSGNGWFDIDQASSSFLVLDSATANTSEYNVNVTVYSASKSLTMPYSAFQCIKNNTCGWDWSKAFSNQASSPNAALAGPLQTIEYTSPNLTNGSIWCISSYAATTANYVLDPSQVTNLFRLVELNVDGENGTLAIGKPLYVDPDWILVGWAVNRDGSVNAGRGAAGHLIIAWQNWVSNGDISQSFADFINIHRFITIQSLSFIPFTTSTKPAMEVGSDKQLSSYAQIQAWKYDLSSQISRLGALVTVAGCLLVIMQAVMYWCYGDDVINTTDILKSIIKRYHLIRDEGMVEAKENYPVLIMDDATGDVGFRA